MNHVHSHCNGKHKNKSFHWDSFMQNSILWKNTESSRLNSIPVNMEQNIKKDIKASIISTLISTASQIEKAQPSRGPMEASNNHVNMLDISNDNHIIIMTIMCCVLSWQQQTFYFFFEVFLVFFVCVHYWKCSRPRDLKNVLILSITLANAGVNFLAMQGPANEIAIPEKKGRQKVCVACVDAWDAQCWFSSSQPIRISHFIISLSADNLLCKCSIIRADHWCYISYIPSWYE